mmetsp:Transcript_14213/g.40384  ORF Transcript_14213/g.40384 Transcript_14213/m.40384 type:complete len:296 (+) Transcript_14213:177-1064(+)
MGKQSKDKRDIYYRKAKVEGWRARSAFKLMQIDDEFGILEGVERAVDLCAAPGSWSQVLSRRLYPEGDYSGKARVVAVDLQDMSPLPGVLQVKGDITRMSTAQQIIDHFPGGQADIVVSDGAPDVTGLHDVDEYVQAQLILAAFNITSFVLKPGGTFLAKIFRGKDMSLMYSQMKQYFERVTIVKPKSSRNSSIEAFILCRHFGGRRSPDFVHNPFSTNMDVDPAPAAGTSAGDPPRGGATEFVSFTACGDLSEFDSDSNYGPLHDGADALEPVRPPIDPPYATYLKLRQAGKLP